MKWISAILIISLFSCGNRQDQKIEVPIETRFVSETILTELEALASSETDSTRLLRQQLYFCEQLDWPIRCEAILKTAVNKFGSSEKLLDQQVAYYLKHDEYNTVINLLNGAFETENRIKAQITASAGLGEDINGLVLDFLDQHPSEDATVFAINSYLSSDQLALARPHFEEILTSSPDHPILLKYLPILERENAFSKAAYIIENQISKEDKSNTDYVIRLAKYYYNLDNKDTSRYLLRTQNLAVANDILIKQFEAEYVWDSAIFYLDKNLATKPDDPTLILKKAELLERRGWVSRSLPFYEQVYAADTTNLELKSHLESVRRKVAYLRQKREREIVAPPPVERKTGN